MVIPYDIISRDLAHLVVSALKVSFERFNRVKNYGKSNKGVFALRLWENIQVGLTSFDQFILFAQSVRKLQWKLWYKLISLCMHYQSTIKFKFKSKQEKWHTKLSFCQNIVWHQTSSCKCSMCLYCVGKVSIIPSEKSLVTPDCFAP